jgi:terminase large subunit-like protein
VTAAVQQVTLPFTPRPHQRAAHAARKRWSVYVWHRRAGKTVFALYELILAALQCTKTRPQFGYIAPYLNQCKGIAWEYLKQYTAPIPGVSYNESELSATLPNGAIIRLFGADNAQALRGWYFDGVCLDEVADMRPTIWGEVLRPALSDRLGWAIFIGTAKGLNLFSKLYFDALKDPDWHAELRRASDTGVIPAEELEQLRRAQTPSQFAQEMECDFAASVDNVLLRLEDALASMKRTLAEPDYCYAPRVLGVDVARYGDDRTVIFPRQGLAAMKPKVLRGADLMEVAGQVALAIDRFQPDATFIDAGGIGAGVIDRLRQLGYTVQSVDFGGRALDPRYENKRTEMWWQGTAWVRDGGCLPDMQELAGELCSPTYSYANARGRLQLESKDTLRARGLPSPDIADAFVLTFASPVAPRAVRAGMARAAAARSVDFNPYE